MLRVDPRPVARPRRARRRLLPRDRHRSGFRGGDAVPGRHRGGRCPAGRRRAVRRQRPRGRRRGPLRRAGRALVPRTRRRGPARRRRRLGGPLGVRGGPAARPHRGHLGAGRGRRRPRAAALAAAERRPPALRSRRDRRLRPGGRRAGHDGRADPLPRRGRRGHGPGDRAGHRRRRGGPGRGPARRAGAAGLRHRRGAPRLGRRPRGPAADRRGPRDDLEALRRTVSAAAAGTPGVTVSTGTDAARAVADDLTGDAQSLTGVLLAFGAIAVLVAGLVIANTFAVLLAQRTRELALLRCVGAGRGQVGRSVLGEAFAVGLLASVVGRARRVRARAGRRGARGPRRLTGPAGRRGAATLRRPGRPRPGHRRDRRRRRRSGPRRHPRRPARGAAAHPHRPGALARRGSRAWSWAWR